MDQNISFEGQRQILHVKAKEEKITSHTNA